MTKRILIADDHALVRKMFRLLMEAENDTSIVEEAVSAQEVVSRCREKEYDLVVLDISMPGRDGLDILAELKIRNPNLRILVLSGHPEERYALRAYKAGASGYICKRSSIDELLVAVRKILQGNKYVSASFAEFLVSNVNQSPHENLVQLLSDRELQVMLLIGSGKTVGGIAAELSLSVKTVSTYRTHILKKMRLKNNAEITRFVIENHL